MYLDEEYLGFTKGKNYIYVITDPGKHTFRSEADNKEEMQLILEANKVYFIEQIPKMGALKARNKLIRLDEAEGREKLGKCKLAKKFSQ